MSKKPNFHDKQGLTSGITDLLGPEAAVSIDAVSFQLFDYIRMLFSVAQM